MGTRLDGSAHQRRQPDLRRFKRAGGKLLIAHGWNDGGLPLARGTIDYYETVECVMGGARPSREFARLFMVPRRGHCIGGDGAAAIDFLANLEDWVDRKKAPDVIIAATLEGRGPTDYIRWPTDAASIRFTRPVYPYPFEARYRDGNPAEYRSFGAVLPRK